MKRDHSRARRWLFQSLIVAVLIAAVLPLAWIVIFGNASKSVVVERPIVDSMSPEEREAWFRENSRPMTLLEKLAHMPELLEALSGLYLKAVAIVFVFVFGVNVAVLWARSGAA